MPTTLFDLTGRVALVTGGARGIGRSICGAFAGAGARIAVTDIDSQEADQTAKELADSGADAWATGLDVTDPDSISKATSAIVARFGRIDILVNNAGINTAR